MYNNYFFLKKFTEELRTRILGEVLEVCYTQHKQELVITFSNETNLLSILHSGWSIVRIPERINRAKKNTVDLFAPLIGKKVEEVRIIDYDRSFYILLGEYKLLFKLHGSRGNIILLKDDQVAELFINAYEKDKQLQFNDIGKHFPDFNKFVEANGNIKSVFPVLGKEAIGFLDTLGYNQLSVDKKWEKFNEIVASFNEASEYFLIKNNNDVQLLLFQEKENTGEVSVFKSPSEALEKFFYLKIRNDTFQQKVDSLKREKLKQEHR
ncbi:MAG: NFACT family protein, partial [Cyclobacteriaceae bacterium]|nr:NFACT family protein [Cyclobacteriaceae bacterium]